jgi:predicted RNA-binding Zn-ribbon protein involved in translation (DUF1610 family)
MDNITQELCPHCGEEVDLPAYMGIYKCPNCGALILPCSLCDWDEVNCEECLFEKCLKTWRAYGNN